jgi:hypothetical protein
MTPKQAFAQLKRAHKQLQKKQQQLKSVLAPFISFDFSINYIYPEGFTIFHEEASLNMPIYKALHYIDKNGKLEDDSLKIHFGDWQ